MVVQEGSSHLNCSVWSGICSHEDWSGNPPGIAIQSAHDGSANLSTVVDLWVQHASHSYHTSARVNIEEEVKFNFYHVIRESVEMKEILAGHVPSVNNPAEIYTKFVPGGAKQKNLIGKLLHQLYKQ